MSEARQTVAGAYQMIAAHEQLCAERYRGINEKLTWVLGSLATMVLALLAWAMVQLYALEPLRRGQEAATLKKAQLICAVNLRRLQSASIAAKDRLFWTDNEYFWRHNRVG